MMPTTTTQMRGARIGARIAPDVLNAVKRAAEIEGRSVSDFIVAAAREAAERTIEKTQILQFSLADQERIADLLSRPTAPNEALARAFTAHKELIRDSR
jgi:uncharacterized protein (DUF1778 family)